MKPSPEAHKLMHDGAKALATVEANGIRIDVDYLDKTIGKVQRRIDSLTGKLKESEEWKVWQRVYRGKANLGSGPQLGRVLFREMGYESSGKTPTGRPSTDVEALERLDNSFVKGLLQVEKLKKLHGTYLTGIRKEVVDGLLRPFINLHLVTTYRSSCDSPNFQNIPIRDKTIGKLIRRAIVSREGRVLVEADYGALEFKVAACFWKDSAMVEYASDPAKDIHRDVAAEIFMLDTGLISKEARYYGKNGFVFPELYGDYYVNCARNIWSALTEKGVETVDGVSVKDFLELKGVVDRKDFEAHIKRVEKVFNDWFPEWSEKKGKWWDDYCRQGWFRTMTGFVCQGIYTRNKVYNYPIQGPAFHCLLWSLIELQKMLRKKRMKSLIIGQIHDSLLLDVLKEELRDVLEMLQEVMVEKLRKAWKWIIVPLEIDVEGSDVNWHEKEALAA